MEAQLAEALRELQHFLQQCGDTRWSAILDRFLAKCTTVSWDDRSGWKTLVIEMQPLFGGMGSLNDLVLCQENGHHVSDERAANQEYQRMVESLYREWKQVRQLV